MEEMGEKLTEAQRVKKAEENMPHWKEDLNKIIKGNDDRIFYETVLDILKELEFSSLTPGLLEELKGTLIKIGCYKSDEWKKIQGMRGLTDSVLGKGVENAKLEWAVYFVGKFMVGDVDVANYAIGKYFDQGYVQDWLTNSQLFRNSNTRLGFEAAKVSARILRVIKGVRDDQISDSTKISSGENQKA